VAHEYWLTVLFTLFCEALIVKIIVHSINMIECEIHTNDVTSLVNILMTASSMSFDISSWAAFYLSSFL
jgi:hypothetical protein